MLKLILLGWIAGIACMGHQFGFISMTWWIWIILSMVMSGLGYYRQRVAHLKIYYKMMICSLNIWAVFCVGYYYADQALLQRLSVKEFQSESWTAIVYIKEIDELSATGYKQVGEVINRYEQVVRWLFYIPYPQQQTKQASPLQLGHYYRITGQIKPAHSYAITGAFDQEKWLLQQNIMATFIVKDIQPLTQHDIDHLGYTQYLKKYETVIEQYLRWVEKIRLRFRKMLQHSDFNNKGLLLALLTGDKSLLSAERNQQFQQLGISHLLAISGPHVLIFAVMVAWLLQQCIRRYLPYLYLWQPRQILILLPFLISVLLYVAFVGFEIPAIRTLYTVILTSIFIFFRVALKPFSILIYSASFLLIYDPVSILSAAFWLSYGACFILFRIYQTIAQATTDHVLSVKQKIFFSARILVESQWKTFIALLPLVIIFFQQVSWIAPITNLVAIPILSGVIVPLDIIAAIIWLLFPSLGKLLFQLNDLFLSWMIYILDAIQHLAPALYGVSFTPIMLVSFIVGLVILFLPQGIMPKLWAWICFLPIFFGLKTPITILSILDVGQGSSILLQHPQHTLLLDTGGSYNEQKFSIAKQVVIPFLRRQGIRQLEHVILSHLDQDHSGAFPAIQKEFAIHQVQANEYSQKMQFQDNFSLCHQGQNWSYPNLKIQILSPHKTHLSKVHEQKNEYSCVIYLQILNAQPYQNFLIMGDAGWETEYQLLQQYPNLKVDVLVLGHHGSKNSSAYDFLATLKPKIAIASAGFDNRYGHPSQLVKRRLQALDIPLLNTIETGTIQFIFQKGHVVLQRQRQQLKWLTWPKNNG